jgi:NADH-quinone oxidoreductase subunit M
VFLLFFEASALPIFILIVYCGSPRRERLKASYYFLFFTLYGSLSLLLLILNCYALVQVDFIAQAPTASYSAWLLLFIAFAVKIPLFPFHIWLPYAHVEASTATSIILAALMLKLGGYGLIRFMLPLFDMGTHLFFRPLALFIGVAGVIYGGASALRQIDLKRQIAFSSVSHMSFAAVGVFTFTEAGIKGATYLMLSHGLTSSALFYLVGVLSDRYHTRSSMAFGGLLGLMPVFSFFMILASLANVGFPGTSGFLPELLVLVAVISSVPFILFPVLLGMLLTTASTLLALLRLLFGHAKAYYVKSTWIDVTKIEFFVLMVLSGWIILMGFYDVLFNI